MTGTIEQKYLAGLNYHGAKPVKKEEGARPQAFERPLTPADVLAWVDRGDRVVLVAQDGRKHVVMKEAVEKGNRGLNAAKSIELVKAAETAEALDQLADGEERKTVLDAIAARRAELAK